MKRSENIKIRVTPDEKRYLLDCAGKSETAKFRKGGDNLSEYLRETIFSASGYRDKKTFMLLRELQYELRKIGVNVNQIAHWINSGLGRSSDIKELKDYLSRIEKAMDNLQEEVKKQWQSQD